MQNLENWILNVHPEWIGLQNETKGLLEIAQASGEVVNNGFLAYPTLNLNEVGPFFQRMIYFKRSEVQMKNGDKAFKYMFAIQDCPGMESGGGNFHFWIFGSTIENTLKYAGIDLDNPRPVPFVLIYEGVKTSDAQNSFHSFSAISIKKAHETTAVVESASDVTEVESEELVSGLDKKKGKK